MMVGGLETCAAWTFIRMGNFQSVEVEEELTVSSSQSKDCDLCCSVRLADAVLFCPNDPTLTSDATAACFLGSCWLGVKH